MATCAGAYEPAAGFRLTKGAEERHSQAAVGRPAGCGGIRAILATTGRQLLLLLLLLLLLHKRHQRRRRLLLGSLLLARPAELAQAVQRAQRVRLAGRR